MNQITRLALAASLLLSAGCVASSQQKMSGKMMHQGQMGLSAGDKAFIKGANQSNLAEIATSQMALKKTSAPNYKDFAQHMIDDHTTAEDDLKQLAQSKNVTLSSSPGAKNEAAAAQLDQLSGAAFLSSYKKIQRNGHLATIALFKKELKNGHDPDVQAFARKYLPKIEGHYTMLMSLTRGSMSHMGSNKM